VFLLSQDRSWCYINRVREGESARARDRGSYFLNIGHRAMCVCGCVCERKREREREDRSQRYITMYVHVADVAQGDFLLYTY
jgi:hypothetical protein